MTDDFWLRLGRFTLVALFAVALFCFVYSQTSLQVGYAVITADSGSATPVGTALFTFTNTNGVMIWQAGVGAAEPIRSGRIFVDQQGRRTAVAIVNPSDQKAILTLVLRDASGKEVDRKNQTLAPRQHLALFVDELFTNLPLSFMGSLSFESDQKLAAITLRESRNVLDEPIYATLPVVDMSATPATGSIVFPQIGAGSNLSTQLVLINRSSQRIGGMIQLIGSDGMPLQFQLTKVSDREIACCPSSASLGEASAAVSSEFPYQIEADGVYRAQLNSSSGTAVGYAVVTLLQGSAAPAGSAIFQFTSNNRVVSEAGVAAVAPTTDARVFVDNRATRTGIAIASPDNPQTTVTFDLMGRSGDLIQRTTRVLPPRGHLPIFVDELFPDAPSNFTGLMEISSPVPVAPVTLKLSINQRNHPILTTLPIADLTRPVTATSLVFPQIGFGAGYSTSLIFIGTDKIRASTGSVSFFRDDGNGLTLPLGVQTDSRFPYRILPGGGVQLTPGQLVAVARIALDPFNPSAKEVIVNEGNIAQLRARALDSDGNIRDEITLAQSSLSPDVAFVDDLGKIQGKLRGFATLKVSGGGTEIRATITVVKVTSGAVVQRKRDKFAEAGFVITGIAQDLGGRVYLADSSDHTILLAPDLESTPALYAGVSQTPGFREDERLKALFQRPSFLVLNQFDGSLYVSDSDNNVIRQVRPGPSGRADTLAGTRQAGSLDGPVNAATFNNPQGMALDDRGNLWIADSNNHTIRRISLDPSKAKTVETVAGRAGVAGAADGVGSAASFNFPAGIAVETESLGQQLAREATGDPPPPVSVIVADTGNGLLRRVKEDGTVETIGAIAAKRNVGRVTFPTSPTLPLTHSPTRPLPRSHTLSLPPSPTPPLSSSLTRPFAVSPLKFKSPTGVAVDPFGNIYVTEANSGQITALLRNGDIAAAAQANTFATPRGIAITRSGKVLVADSSRSNGEITYGEPSISSINPGRVSNKGGALVTISGRNFAPETVVIVGGVVANPQVLDTQTLTVIAPPLPSGRLTLTVQNRGGVAQKPLLVDPIPLSDLLPGQITTVAGGTTFTGDGGPATEATLFSPQQMAVDPAGNIFFTDANNNRIRKINAATGIITAVAGNGQIGFSGDGGPAIAASLAFPRGIAIDSAGNLYVADTANSRVRKIVAATGTITTVAGRGLGPFAGDGGPATQATLNAPRAVAIDGAGNLLIADTSNHRIRKVDAKTGIITTIAGTDPDFGGDNGPATAAALRSPQGIALDASGNVFVADTVNQRIRRIDAASKVITTVAGNGQAGFSGDLQSATSAMLNSPAGITVDVAGNLFIGDTANHRVRRVDASTRIITTVAGTGVQGFSGDGGPATQAALSSPYGVATDGAGNLLIVDQGNSRIRRVSAGTITTVAGNGQQSFLGDGGPATAANLLSPQGIAVDAAGNFFIADFGNQRIRKVTASTGIITTVAGTGIAGFLGDNVPAASSPLSSPTGVAIDGSGNLFISDSLNNRIRKVDGAGVITTVAGNGQSDFSGDNGPATAASLNLPQGIAIDRAGVLYVADTNHNRIRRVDLRSGIITTAVGGGSPSDRLGDNGPATDAALNSPTGIAVDSAGNLVIADSGNNRVRRVDAATGIITTVAGNGQASSSGDNGPATAAGLNHPVGVKFDAAGNLFVSEETRIRRVAAKTGVITTVAGNGISGFTGDNTQATNTALKLPSFLDFDPAGNLLFADTGNYRIRGIRAPIP